MRAADKQWGKIIPEFSFALAVVLNSLWVFYTYLLIAPTGSYLPADFSKILEGTADRPFVSRVLIPLIAKILGPLVPQWVIELFSDATLPVRDLFEHLSGQRHAPEAVVTILIMFLSLIGFAYAERGFIHNLHLNKARQFLLPLIGQILILPFTFRFSYYYDLTQLFLMTLALLFLYQSNWKAYLIVFAAATLNKELSFTLILVYAVYFFPRLPRHQFVLFLFEQILVYALIRIPLFLLFSNNNGSFAPLMLGFHYYRYTTVPIVLIYTLCFFGVIAFFVVKEWRQTDPFLHAGLAIFAVIFVLFFISGNPLEFRVFLDSLPILVIYFPPIKTQWTQNSPERISL